MPHIFNLKSLVAFLCLSTFFATPAFPQEARLTNFVVTNNRDDLLLFMKVEGAYNQNMKDAILSGVPATFHFKITLNKIRSFWLNREIASREITHTITYNPLKKEFKVKRSWERDPITTQSFTEAKTLMTDVDSLKIVSLDALEKGVRYQIQAKAKLDKVTLPFSLHYVLFFASLWDFETDWHSIEFYY
jgi:hypothetical protein